jgi:hypothetical protein
MEGGGEEIEIDRTPTPMEELETFDPERARAMRLRNDSDEQDMGERRRYAGNAYGITQTWVGFLIVLTFAQLCLKPLGLGLGREEFIAVFTTTTASVFGFWLLVGRYLFPDKSKKGD